MFIWVMYSAPIRSIGFNKIDQMDSKIGFEMSLIVVEGIRGRCASFMLLTATVSEIFGGKTNSPILVVDYRLQIYNLVFTRTYIYFNLCKAQLNNCINWILIMALFK